MLAALSLNTLVQFIVGSTILVLRLFWGDSTPYRMAAGIASQNLYDYQNINNLLPWSHIGAIRNGSTVGLCGK